jgi:hypothetical protein
MSKTILLVLVFTLLFLIGCGQTSRLYTDPASETSQPPAYTVIYYIHADGDYLYHLADRTPVRGNEQVLASAIEVAQHARSGEIFIFHQKSQRKRFGLFPRNQNAFYHYRNGKLQTSSKYRYGSGDTILFSKESDIVKYYRTNTLTPNHQSYFFYFGHEIPIQVDNQYNPSFPEMVVTTETFGAELKRFLSTDQVLDLVVLSTCNNATAPMASQLTPYANFLLASPQNLHLSHIDTDAISMLESNRSTTPEEIAFAMASNTFTRLSDQVFTAVTLSIVDLKTVKSYVNDLTHRITSYRAAENPNLIRDNIDCKELDFFVPEIFTHGITSYYRPAKFGRPSASATHSGWGCKK